MATPTVTCRRIEASDWELFRELRLEMITTEPDAFTVNIDEWLAYDDDFWKDFAARSAESDTDITYFAEVDGVVAAVANACIKDDGIARFGMLYVRPSHRRAGLADLLLAARSQWAIDRGATQVWCDIEPTNSSSIALHVRYGWIPDIEAPESTRWVIDLATPETLAT